MSLLTKHRHILLFMGIYMMMHMPSMRAQTWDPEAYDGWRIGLMNFKEVKVDKKQLSFRCDVANTGRMSLPIRPGTALPTRLVLTADASLEKEGLAERKDEIAAALAATGIDLEAGAVIRNRRFVLDLKTWRYQQSQYVPTAGDVSTIPDRFYFSDTLDGCPDLIVDTLMILDQSKSTWELNLVIRNKGTGPARLYDPSDKHAGFPVSFFTGNTPRISRSSRFVEGMLVQTGLADSDGILQAGKTLHYRTSLSRRGLPDYHHQIQVRLDNFQFVEECDETNNEYVLPFRAAVFD